MTYPSCRPSPWLLAPAMVALALLSVAHRDVVVPSLCLLCIVGSYFHPWCASLPKRHPWLVSAVTCAVLGVLCLLYDQVWLVNGAEVAYFPRLWCKPWLVSAGASLQAVVLLWVWHLPNRATGLIFACMGLIAISSGNALPSSHGIVNLYALFGGACLLNLFVLGGALHSGCHAPFRERCRQSLMVLMCIAIISAGTWYLSASLQQVSQVFDTLVADLMPGSPYRDPLGAGHSIRIAHQRHVRLSRRVVATLTGHVSPVYLRTQVMTRYQQHRWTPSPVPSPRPLDSTQKPRTPQHADQREIRLHVNLRGALPLPYNVAEVRVPELLSCWQIPGALIQCSPASQLTSYAFRSSVPRRPIPFGIGFALPASNTASSHAARSQSLEDALTAPEAVVSQLRPIARRIVGPSASHALVSAQKIQQHFRQHFTYSRHVNLSPELDPIVDFVRHRRPAYCEYFASGMALMLRALGIPARVVGGFLVWEYNGLLRQWIVRQRDAHAWVEVYDEGGQRWVGFDATPASRQELFSRTSPAGFWEQSRTWTEWQVRTVINHLYHIDIAAGLARLRPPDIGRGLIVGLGLIGLIIFVRWLWRRLTPSIKSWWQQLQWAVRRRPSRISDAVQAEAQQHFARLSRLLQRRGSPILPTETLEEYLQRISSQAITSLDAPTLDLLTDFSQTYHQLRFRPRPAEPAACRAMLQARLHHPRHLTDQLYRLDRATTPR